MKENRRISDKMDPQILSVLKIPSDGSQWKDVWYSKFENSVYWFFLGQLLEENTKLRIRRQIKEREKLFSSPPLRFIPFNEFRDYLNVLDSKELKNELQEKIDLLKEKEAFPELLSENIISECKTLEERLQPLLDEVSIKEELSLVETIKDEEVLEKSPQKEASLEYLEGSLPSLFRFRYSSLDSIEPPKKVLKPIPNWIKKLSKLFYRWSILRHMTQEQIDNFLKDSLDWDTAKENIQWLDPQEKSFYIHLPAVNLFFDRFREDLKDNLVTSWDEPEEALSLSEIEIGESFDFYRASVRPIFLYEGITPLTIGEDLNEISALLDFYEDLYRKQTREELKQNLEDTEGISLESSQILRTLEEAEQDFKN